MVNGKTIDWTTFAIFIVGAIGSVQAYVLGYIPVEYVPLATAIFGVISQIGSLIRNKQENVINFYNGLEQGNAEIGAAAEETQD